MDWLRHHLMLTWLPFSDSVYYIAHAQYYRKTNFTSRARSRERDRDRKKFFVIKQERRYQNSVQLVKVVSVFLYDHHTPYRVLPSCVCVCHHAIGRVHVY